MIDAGYWSRFAGKIRIFQLSSASNRRAGRFPQVTGGLAPSPTLFPTALACPGRAATEGRPYTPRLCRQVHDSFGLPNALFGLPGRVTRSLTFAARFAGPRVPKGAGPDVRTYARSHVALPRVLQAHGTCESATG